jgi:hypothetical protein
VTAGDGHEQIAKPRNQCAILYSRGQKRKGNDKGFSFRVFSFGSPAGMRFETPRWPTKKYYNFGQG